jgi:hypothetical protein
MTQAEGASGSGGEFTVNLVSNASMDVYQNNKLSSFTTRLPGKGINLPIYSDGGHWEVALTEINYPSKFYNIIEGGYGMTSTRTTGDVFYTSIPAGLYKSIDQILGVIHELWLDLNDHLARQNKDTSYKREGTVIFTSKYDQLTNRLQIKMLEEGSQLVLSDPDIRAVFGYSEHMARNEIAKSSLSARKNAGWITGDYAPDLQRLHTALIYTDIIEHQIIGDTLAPLLRLIPLTGKLKNNEISTMENTQVSRSFNLPLQFKKVQVNSFHSIQLQMYGENGKLLPFVDAGRTSATLLFRYNKHS